MFFNSSYAKIWFWGALDRYDLAVDLLMPFLFLLNEKPCGFFRSSRGLRQGDPLSPALFIIAAEVLSRGLNTLVGDLQFSPYFVTRGCPPLTHLAYADDIIIFCNGSKRSLACVMEVLGKY